MADSRPSAPFPRSSSLPKRRRPNGQSPGQQGSGQESPSLSDHSSTIAHIPGEPSIELTKAAVCDFLTSELSTLVLDELYDNLWLVARRRGDSIDPLNRQRVKAREIIAAEDAHLHLVWGHNRIYVKPMPQCLLDYDFWATYLPLPDDSTSSNQKTVAARQFPPNPVLFDRAVAIGFMRSYALLVRHRVDFTLARESHLLPAEIDWMEWSEFIRHFRKIEDEDVAKRYHYGQLRLSRLNWAVRFFRPSSAATRWFYEIPYWSTGMYVQRVIAPLIIGFTSLSLVLSSMQVLLAVPEDGLGFQHVDASSVVDMRRAFWVFSVMMLLSSGLVWVLLVVIPLSVIIWQLAWGFRNRGKPAAQSLRAVGPKGQTVIDEV